MTQIKKILRDSFNFAIIFSLPQTITAQTQYSTESPPNTYIGNFTQPALNYWTYHEIQPWSNHGGSPIFPEYKNLKDMVETRHAASGKKRLQIMCGEDENMPSRSRH